MRVLFAHGFEGTPEGSKPDYMREELGWDLVTPVMSELGWSIEQETKVLLRLIDNEGPFDLVSGSSMGGLAAANASALRPDEDFSLLLIAPAFGLDELWRRGAKEEGLAKWNMMEASNTSTMDSGMTLHLTGTFFCLLKKCHGQNSTIQL